MPYERTFQAASVGAKTRSAGACLARGKLGDGRAFFAVLRPFEKFTFLSQKMRSADIPSKRIFAADRGNI